MLVIRQNVSKIQLMTLSTSVVRPRKDPLKQYKKKLQDKKLEKIQKADPFVTNVGMRHQLKNMDLPFMINTESGHSVYSLEDGFFVPVVGDSDCLSCRAYNYCIS